jgi:hypothetical protein
MRRLALFLSAVCLLPAPWSRGQSDRGTPLPKILAAGFDAYRAGGPDEAMRVWIRGGPLESAPDAGKEEQILHAAQGQFGPWRSVDVISIHQISASTQIFYLTLDFDRGPLFAKFVIYRTEPGWVVSSVLFSPNDADVLPVQQP